MTFRMTYRSDMTAIDLIGQRFGRLIVLGRSAKKVPNHSVWDCRCDCGNETAALSNNLRRGLTASCGCGVADACCRTMLRHGLARKGQIAPEHRIWRGIIERCTNPNSTSYEYYGARGIRICERWMTFENFYADMGPRPSPELSIDRKDVNGHYEPGNCRWATPLEQRHNRRDSK